MSIADNCLGLFDQEYLRGGYDSNALELLSADILSVEFRSEGGEIYANCRSTIANDSFESFDEMYTTFRQDEDSAEVTLANKNIPQ